MKILIFGGTGAIGKPLVDFLRDKIEYEVTVTTRNYNNISEGNIIYVYGDAKNDTFLDDILDKHYDVLVDFMIYNTSEFRVRYKKILDSVDHYIYISSARVCIDSGKGKLNEFSPRLLDTSSDEAYLASDEYSIAKARQENILNESKNNNYTIIRPYMTYNSGRIQLGALEKEYWLQRAIQKKPILFQKDISEKITTLTYGQDVAHAIALLIGNEEAKGETYMVTSGESMPWYEVLNLYVGIIKDITGIDTEIIYENNSDMLAKCFRNPYQLKYDRCLNRSFDNTKIKTILKDQLSFTPLEIGMRICIKKCLESSCYLDHNVRWEAYSDHICGVPMNESTEKGKNRLKYFIFRCFPGMLNM